MELSRIQKVQLREIWKHEATNFTRWLAKQENLALLSEEINIELTVNETEYNVGRIMWIFMPKKQTLEEKLSLKTN